MENDGEQKLLFTHTAQIRAINLALIVLTVGLVKNGQLDATQFVAHLQHEYAKLPMLEQDGHKPSVVAQQLGDRVIADLVQFAQQADASRG